MTRIFDALKKVRGDRPPDLAAAAEPPPLQSVPGRTLPLPPRGERPAVNALGPVAPLDESALREMSSLRVHLDASFADRLPRSVMFVSSMPGEGASTVAMQFAETLARDGALRVLIVDANLLRSSPLYEAGRTGADRRGRGALDMLSLAERFGRGRIVSAADLRHAMEPLGADYDWIVYDGPAMLEAPESASLASVPDGVVVVVEAGRTKRPVLTRAVDLLRKTGARVVGTVLNRRRLEIPDFIYRRV